MTALPAKVDPVFSKDNVELAPGAGAMLWKGLAGLGALLTAVAVIAAFASSDDWFRSTALHALHVGFLGAIAFPVAALVFVMMLHQTGAGWSATIRRQFENMMSLVWIAVPMFFGILALQWLLTMGDKSKYSPFLWNWMNPAYTDGDPLYTHKEGFLNPWFFLIRALVYFAVWIGLSMALWSLSTRQDSDGNKWHTLTARKVSAIGILIFAFATAFAGFDWVMALDYHWFSTMLGVHFFAKCMVSMLCLGTLTFIVLHSRGRLHVAFTPEHLHDLSKLVFAFVVFWAYISFSQYFLIWYANIPEETTYFQIRKMGDWTIVSWLLPILHFIIPFIVLLPRPFRRSTKVMGFMCVYLMLVQLLDTYWYVRPQAGGLGPWQWVDFAGALGPVLIFIGLFIRKVASGPLIPLKDPRLPEALHHKNYI